MAGFSAADAASIGIMGSADEPAAALLNGFARIEGVPVGLMHL